MTGSACPTRATVRSMLLLVVLLMCFCHAAGATDVGAELVLLVMCVLLVRAGATGDVVPPVMHMVLLLATPNAAAAGVGIIILRIICGRAIAVMVMVT